MVMDELNSSELGTKEYWNEAYKKELHNFYDVNDFGHEWFGRSAKTRVVKWICTLAGITKEASILDIGCGNGLMLLELAKLGFCKLTGVDYCKNALELAKNVFTSEGFGGFSVMWLPLDITSQTIIEDLPNKIVQAWSDDSNYSSNYVQKTFDLCLDKGTYDAISLCPQDSRKKRNKYIEKIKLFLKPSGFFIIVSCNWTTKELKEHFKDLCFVGELSAPQYSFGGMTGQTVSTCIFKPVFP